MISLYIMAFFADGSVESCGYGGLDWLRFARLRWPDATHYSAERLPWRTYQAEAE